MKAISIDFAPRNSNWRAQAANLRAWEAWDAGWRKKLGWWAALSFWGKTNVPRSRTVVVCHWPHRLCWSWFLLVGMRREGFDGPRRLSLHITRKYQHAEIWLWWFYARLVWQDSDWMVNVGPDYRKDAPTIYWHNRFENAEPMGHA